MPKYFFLYKNDLYDRNGVFQSDHTANTEAEVREWFEKHYNARMIDIRKGRKFSESEIRRKKIEQRYA